MSRSMAQPAAVRHREIPEMRPDPVKANLRKAETVDYRAETGACFARACQGLSLKQVAGYLHRDERQIARWFTGAERVQVDVVMACPELAQPFAYQLAQLSGAVALPSRLQFDKVSGL